MPDQIDEATELSQALTDQALRRHKSRVPSAPVAKGECLHCGSTDIEIGRRWCDALCRNDWERERGPN